MMHTVVLYYGLIAKMEKLLSRTIVLILSMVMKRFAYRMTIFSTSISRHAVIFLTFSFSLLDDHYLDIIGV